MNRAKIIYNIHRNKSRNIQIHYLFKNKDFYTSNFKLLYPVLIPRSETEIIINLYKSLLKNIKDLHFLDLCSGSGIIGTSLRMINKNIKITMVDKMYIFFSLCKINCNLQNNIKCNLKYYLYNKKNYNEILTNPPYICSKILFTYLNDKSKVSFHANLKGFIFFFNIIKKSHNVILNNGGMVIEHGYNQAKKIRYTCKILGFINICTFKDISNLHRLTYAEK